jgi:hypothetical protein
MNGVPDLLIVCAIFSLSNFSVLPLVRLTTSFFGLALFAFISTFLFRALLLPLALAFAGRLLGAALLDFLRIVFNIRAQPC